MYVSSGIERNIFFPILNLDQKKYFIKEWKMELFLLALISISFRL